MNDICLCGHERIRHADWEDKTDYGSYLEDEADICICLEFKLDNLKYLEMINDK